MCANLKVANHQPSVGAKSDLAMPFSVSTLWGLVSHRRSKPDHQHEIDLLRHHVTLDIIEANFSNKHYVCFILRYLIDILTPQPTIFKKCVGFLKLRRFTFGCSLTYQIEAQSLINSNQDLVL